MIIKFQYFINESNGISDYAMKIKNIIWKDVINHIKNNIETDNKYLVNGTINFFNKYYKFNIDNINIDRMNFFIKFQKRDKSLCVGINRNNDTYFENNIMYNSVIEIDCQYVNFNESELDYIESLILHEVLHLIQKFNLKSEIPNHFKLALQNGINISRFNDYYDLYLISSLLYLTTTHELSAQIHQYYDYKLKGKKYDYIYFIMKFINMFNVKNIIINDDLIEGLNQIKIDNINVIDNSYGIWNTEINKNNVYSFLNNLDKKFKKSLNFIEDKIKQVDAKAYTWEHINMSKNESFLNIICLFNFFIVILYCN